MTITLICDEEINNGILKICNSLVQNCSNPSVNDELKSVLNLIIEKFNIDKQ